MPDSYRFADLGSGTRAGERLADLDHRDSEPRPDPPRRRASYTWVVGVAAVILIAVVSLNSLPNERRGTSGPPAGKPTPHFAAPSATGPLDGDPNIKQASGDQSTANDTPACEVRVEGALRVCDFFRDKPLVLTFIVPTRECERFVDRVERLRARFAGVSFVTVVSAPKERVARIVEQRGWRQPVAVDRNGAVLTRYRLGLCANVVFAYRGGKVRATKVRAQDWTDAQLVAAIRATEAR